MTKWMIVLAAVLLCACSGRQMYDSAQPLRRSQCDQVVDSAEHRRCMEAADMDYERYRKEKDKPAP
ncbi:hypothetical protein [Methyloversatilis thermotolerans]|uniref:hypothetical protein n=1 Tax=Methyloversatilis thermotolerans TaxID=1346290 RepID=UPI0003681772|nr:hypothetical protein [Methyloversatilis thermotolerans]